MFESVSKSTRYRRLHRQVKKILRDWKSLGIIETDAVPVDRLSEMPSITNCIHTNTVLWTDYYLNPYGEFRLSKLRSMLAERAGTDTVNEDADMDRDVDGIASGGC